MVDNDELAERWKSYREVLNELIATLRFAQKLGFDVSTHLDLLHSPEEVTKQQLPEINVLPVCADKGGEVRQHTQWPAEELAPPDFEDLLRRSSELVGYLQEVMAGLAAECFDYIEYLSLAESKIPPFEAFCFEMGTLQRGLRERMASHSVFKAAYTTLAERFVAKIEQTWADYKIVLHWLESNCQNSLNEQTSEWVAEVIARLEDLYLLLVPQGKLRRVPMLSSDVAASLDFDDLWWLINPTGSALDVIVRIQEIEREAGPALSEPELERLLEVEDALCEAKRGTIELQLHNRTPAADKLEAAREQRDELWQHVQRFSSSCPRDATAELLLKSLGAELEELNLVEERYGVRTLYREPFEVSEAIEPSFRDSLAALHLAIRYEVAALDELERERGSLDETALAIQELIGQTWRGIVQQPRVIPPPQTSNPNRPEQGPPTV